MKCLLQAIVGRHTEWGPDAAGATSEDLLRETQAGPGGGPACVLRGILRLRWAIVVPCRHSRSDTWMPIQFLTPWPGTDGNHSCGCGDCGAADEDTAALFHVRGGFTCGRPNARVETVARRKARGVSFVDDAAFHAAGDDHDLAGHLARGL